MLLGAHTEYSDSTLPKEDRISIVRNDRMLLDWETLRVISFSFASEAGTSTCWVSEYSVKYSLAV